MPWSQSGPLAPNSSSRRQLSPRVVVTQGSATPQTARRTTKRTKQPQEQSQLAHVTSSTGRTTSTPPVKLFKGHASNTVSRRTAETNEQNRHQPVIVPQPSVLQHPQTFSGNFDLYGMYLPVLAKLCLPLGATVPNYPAVYDKILSSQAKHDFTARCYLAPHDLSSSTPPHGRFESVSVLDPMAERPFEIMLDCFTCKKNLAFTTTERTSFQAPEYSMPGPGLVGHTGLSPACGVKNAKGVFKIKRVWVKEQDSSAKELFEGFFSFSVCYDSMYRKAAHGNGATYKFAFWGARAMKDNAGKEIGLGPRRVIL